MKKTLVALGALVAVVASAQAQTQTQTNNPATNWPTAYVGLGNLIQSMPTVPLNQAKLFIATGAWNGPSVNPTNGAVSTALQNYIDLDYSVSSNFLAGVEIRNVISTVDYAGINLTYMSAPYTNFLVGPELRAGWDIDNRVPQGEAGVHFMYQPVAGLPYVDASFGYAESFGLGFGRSHAGGSGSARAGIVVPLP